MKILLLGGTGAIGKSLAPLLLKQNNIKLYITSRSGGHLSENPRLVYYQCNAMDIVQLKEVLQRNEYEAIIDFMNYHSTDFDDRYKLLLSSTKHYVFISSCRVFANQDIVSESSVQLLDSIDNIDYLKRDTYSLAKSRCEDILKGSGFYNYTIVRPYITYNSNRFQLGIYEKEHFLYRALNGRPIVISEDILGKTTSMTSSEDVAKLILLLVLLPPEGKSYNLASSEKVTWRDILKIYSDSISRYTGKEVKIKYTINSYKESELIYSEEKYKYDRLYNRVFQSEDDVLKEYEFTPISKGLKSALEIFLAKPSFNEINWRFEAYLDYLCGSFASYKEFNNIKSYFCYLGCVIKNKLS